MTKRDGYLSAHDGVLVRRRSARLLAGASPSTASAGCVRSGNPTRVAAISGAPATPRMKPATSTAAASRSRPDILSSFHQGSVACGPRIREALALNETDVDITSAALRIRHEKDDKRRGVGTDRWAWSHLEPLLALRNGLPVGRPFCIRARPYTRHALRAGRGIRAQLHETAMAARVPRRLAPHQFDGQLTVAPVPAGDPTEPAGMATHDPASDVHCLSRKHTLSSRWAAAGSAAAKAATTAKASKSAGACTVATVRKVLTSRLIRA
jgi:integrase